MTGISLCMIPTILLLENGLSSCSIHSEVRQLVSGQAVNLLHVGSNPTLGAFVTSLKFRERSAFEPDG